MERHAIIIGNTIAAYQSAITLVSQGVLVTWLSRQGIIHSPSLMIRDGVNATLTSPDPAVSAHAHVWDMVEASHGLVDQELALQMSEAAPQLVRMLDRMGVPFERSPEGYIQTREVGDASEPRMARVGNHTAQSMVYTLSGQVDRYIHDGLITLKEYYMTLSYIQDGDGAVIGVVAQDMATMAMETMIAPVTIVATAAPMAIFDAATYTYHHDGIEMMQAARLGARLANCECVALTDTTTDCFGGLWVDDNGMTTLDGLFAAGPAQHRLYGAGVAAGDHLLIELFTGVRAAHAAADYLVELDWAEPPSSAYATDALEHENRVQEAWLMREGDDNLHDIYRTLVGAMSALFGDARHAEGLKATLGELYGLRDRLTHCSLSDKGHTANMELFFARSLAQMIEMARVIITSASARCESRGVHQRTDYPEMDNDRWQVATQVTWQESTMTVDTDDVIDTSVFPEVLGSIGESCCHCEERSDDAIS